MKIGIFGGTFDPIHKAHLKIAKEIYDEFFLDQILFIPSGNSYLKEHVTDKYMRYEMVSLAIKDIPEFSVSTIETNSQGPSYTINTIRLLQEKNPNDEFFFLMGSDLLPSLGDWKEAEELFKIIPFIVYNRLGFPKEKIRQFVSKYKKLYKAMIYNAKGTLFDISSTEIREAIGNGIQCKEYLPDSVAIYIKEKGLYNGQT